MDSPHSPLPPQPLPREKGTPLEAATERLADEVAALSASLAQRAAWSASITAEHAVAMGGAADEALAAVAGAREQTRGFLDSARVLAEEFPALYELQDATKRVLGVLTSLEARVDKDLSGR